MLILDQLEAILASLPDPVFILTRSGRYAGVFGGSDTRYYHDGSSLVGQNIQDVLNADKANWFLQQIEFVLAERKLHIVEYGLSGDDIKGLPPGGPADTLWFEGRIQALPFAVDGEDAVLWVASNVTARITLEMQLSDAMRREREAINILWQRVNAFQKTDKTASWQLDPSGCSLTPPDGTAIRLTAGEVALLTCMARRPLELITKDELCAEVFPGVAPGDHARLDVLVSRLRQKAKQHRCALPLRTLFGKGILLSEHLKLS